MSDVDETCTYVDNFIRDLLSGNIEIDYQKAKDLHSYRKDKSFWSLETGKDNEEFSSILGHALYEYQMSKRENQELHLAYADKCFKFIVWASTFNVVKRIGLSSKVKVLQIENNQLKEEKDKYQKEIARLTLLNEALHQTLDKLGLKRIGDGKEPDGEE